MILVSIRSCVGCTASSRACNAVT